jgi:hypothetical protein
MVSSSTFTPFSMSCGFANRTGQITRGRRTAVAAAPSAHGSRGEADLLRGNGDVRSCAAIRSKHFVGVTASVVWPKSLWKSAATDSRIGRAQTFAHVELRLRAE